MVEPTPIPGRLDELLAGEAAGDLDRGEYDELQRMLPAANDPEREAVCRAATLTQLALLKSARAASPLPHDVRSRLNHLAGAWQAGRQVRPSSATTDDLELARRRRDAQRLAPPRGVTGRRAANLGWYAAAALALVFIGTRFAPVPATPAPADMRTALLAAEPGLVRAAWNASSEPGYERAGGDVVWSSARQEGYLRLAGLPASEPGRTQYQLWVVDPERDARPVDGGVFDVAPGAGEIVVPIQAKLPVGRPTAFAITLEQSGGVVVSDGPMLLVASVGS